MKLDFLKDHYPQLHIDVFSEDEDKWAIIHHPKTNAEIRIYYVPDDVQPFVFRFGYQHIHIATENQLIDCITEYISGQISAIEFFKDGSQRFGLILKHRLSQIATTMH